MSTPLPLSRRTFLRAGVATAASAPFFSPHAQSVAAPATPATSAPSETVCFAFDDHAIPWRHNLKLTLVQAGKHPQNPVVRCGPEGAPDHGHAIIYGSVIQIGGKFRMWYLGMIQRKIERGQAPGWWRPMCYAESEDGIHWTKPELGLVEFNGNKRNNICLIESDPFSLSRVNDFLSVLHDPEDPDPARRYKVAYIAHLPFEDVRGGRSALGPNESRWCSAVCATSADGLSWRVAGDRPVNSGGERFEVAGLYRFGGSYYITGQLLSPWTATPDGRDVGRVMLAFRSPDFVNWSRVPSLAFARPGQLLATPIPGQQTHMGAGMWNRGNVIVGLYGQWQDGPKEKPKGSTHLWGTRIDLGLVLSNDGVAFREPVPDFKVIPRGGEGEWDSIALLQGHAFANVGERTYIWYSHWDCEGQFRSQEIGLATLRRDGFGYLSARTAGAPAQCVTRHVEAADAMQGVFVNAEGVSAEAPLIVELLDEADRPIAGYSSKLTVSGTRVPAGWGALPAGRKFAIRAELPPAGAVKLYALYVG
jgi:hypothetical protein